MTAMRPSQGHTNVIDLLPAAIQHFRNLRSESRLPDLAGIRTIHAIFRVRSEVPLAFLL